MENNQENVQNQVNDVEQDVKSEKGNANKPQRSGKGKTIVLLILVLILVLVLGICGGLLLSGNGDTIINNIKQGTENDTESKEENKAGKKVDESKPWVYDADYGKDKVEKKITPEYSTEIVSSIEKLKVPYININSDYAKQVNSEIEELYEKSYEEFGKKYSGATGYVDLEYNYYNNDKVLSVVITVRTGVLNGGLTRDYKRNR